MEYYLPYLLALGMNASDKAVQVTEAAPHTPTTGEYIAMGIVVLLVVSFVAWFTRPREY